jgi:Bax protein
MKGTTGTRYLRKIKFGKFVMSLKFHQKLALLAALPTLGAAVIFEFTGTGVEEYTQKLITLDTTEVAANTILDTSPAFSPTISPASSPVLSPAPPPGLAAKKSAFIESVLPAIHLENHLISQLREGLLRLQHKPLISSGERDWLRSLGRQYKIRSSLSESARISELLVRADKLPPSLAVAQAAIESAWGTSRFAQLGNNLFGQWCMTRGCGIVPSGRAGEASHEVRKYDSVQESVHGYFMNINTNRAYRSLRNIRTCQRGKGELLSGTMLAAGLQHYSEIGEAYVKSVRRVIRFNRLDSLDYLSEGLALTTHVADSQCSQQGPERQELDSTLVAAGA